MNVINPFDFFLEEYADNYPFKYDDATNHEVQTYLLKGEPNRLLLDFIEPVLPKKPLRTVDFLVAFNQYILTMLVIQSVWNQVFKVQPKP
jgi:hypothetical protein